jgi:fatty acid desaturase
VSRLVFPLSDRYHLAHSLYPYVRWSYLPAIDRHLRAHDPHYAVYQSAGLLFPRGPLPAALSELRERLSAPRPGDLAAWGERFAVTRRA